jgi:hypothetical protein
MIARDDSVSSNTALKTECAMGKRQLDSDDYAETEVLERNEIPDVDGDKTVVLGEIPKSPESRPDETVEIKRR